MKRLGELMRRDPTPTEREAMEHVVDLALAWQRGDLSLASVGRQCSGYERWQAIRFVALASEEKRALMALVDAFVAADETVIDTDQGLLPREELFSGSLAARTDWQGRRVFVVPMFFKDGSPHYPLVHLEPGEKRREREEAMRGEYRRYRKAKGAGEG